MFDFYLVFISVPCSRNIFYETKRNLLTSLTKHVFVSGISNTIFLYLQKFSNNLDFIIPYRSKLVSFGVLTIVKNNVFCKKTRIVLATACGYKEYDSEDVYTSRL